MNLNSLKTQYFEGIYKTKAFLIKDTPFILQSGAKSHLYLNHRNFLSSNNYLNLVANIYHELTKEIKQDYQLGAVDSIMSPIIVGAMSAMFNKDYIVILNQPLTHGTQEYIYGDIKKPIVLIDDMSSTGGTLIDAARKIRINGGIVEYAIISAYRDDTAIKNLEKNNIKLLNVAGFNEILSYLYPSLTETEKLIIKKDTEVGI